MKFGHQPKIIPTREEFHFNRMHFFFFKTTTSIYKIPYLEDMVYRLVYMIYYWLFFVFSVKIKLINLIIRTVYREFLRICYKIFQWAI